MDDAAVLAREALEVAGAEVDGVDRDERRSRGAEAIEAGEIG
jgi:hypothetical protein